MHYAIAVLIASPLLVKMKADSKILEMEGAFRNRMFQLHFLDKENGRLIKPCDLFKITELIRYGVGPRI